MQVWNMLHVARCKYRTQKSRQKSSSGHHRTTLWGYIFATKARIDNRKKLVKQQDLLHMTSQYGELRSTNGWDWLTSLGHPCKFQLVSRLGSVTARHLVVGVSQTLRRWTEGATYIQQGDHHVGHWPTFLVLLIMGVYRECRDVAGRGIHGSGSPRHNQNYVWDFTNPSRKFWCIGCLLPPLPPPSPSLLLWFRAWVVVKNT